MNNNSKPTITNQSSEKLLIIMEFLSSQSEPTRLLDIAESTGLNASTVSRFLSALINREYVKQDAVSGKYFLTYKICKLAFNVSQNSNLRQICLPYLNKISVDTLCTTNLVVEYDMSVMYLEVIMPSRQMIEPLKRIGGIAPMHCTGAGKLLLTSHSQDFIASLYNKKGFERFTEHTLTTIEDLTKEIKQIEKQNYSYDNEECEYGTRCFAVPIYDYTNKIIASLSINGSIQKMTDDFINSKKALMLRSAKEISHRLGYSGDFNIEF